jgi:DNA-binding MarR family transcriptional regulator
MADKYPLDLNGTGYCASLNIRRAARAITSLYDSIIGASGIRSTGFAILVAIAKSEPVPISKLGGVLGIDSTTLSRSLRLLERRGLIAVSTRSTMRQRFVTLLPSGKRTLAQALPFWRQVQEIFEKEVAGAQWKRMQRDLEKIAVSATNYRRRSSDRLHARFGSGVIRPKKVACSDPPALIFERP